MQYTATMKPLAMKLKKLSINRDSLRQLTHDDLGAVGGGAVQSVKWCSTYTDMKCPDDQGHRPRTCRVV